jgi:hypothetical protein
MDRICRWGFARLLSGLVAGAIILPAVMARVAGAHEVLALHASNLRWHAPAKSLTATFLGKDEKETAVLVLKKAAVFGTEVSIQSDASAITIVSGDSLRIAFPVDPAPDGAVSKVKMTGGDQPALLFNEKERARDRGKWIELVESKEKNVTIELANASFATVTFEAKALDQGLDATPPTPTAAQGAPGAVARTPGASGGADTELLHTVTPAQLRAASDAFANGVSRTCPHCSGSGKVTVSVQTGTRQEGRLTRPLYTDETRQCDRCRGTGHLRASDEVLNRLAGTFLKSLSSLKQDDPKSQDAISDAYKMITASMVGDFKTWTLLTENGRSILSQRTPVPGTPVIAKALIKQSYPKQNGKRLYLVEIGGTDKLVLVSDPVSADELQSGPALIGGLVESAERQTADRRAIAIVSQGFLVAPPIEKGWYWWWWWRTDGPADPPARNGGGFARPN